MSVTATYTCDTSSNAIAATATNYVVTRTAPNVKTGTYTFSSVYPHQIDQINAHYPRDGPGYIEYEDEEKTFRDALYSTYGDIADLPAAEFCENAQESYDDNHCGQPFDNRSDCSRWELALAMCVYHSTDSTHDDKRKMVRRSMEDTFYLWCESGLYDPDTLDGADRIAHQFAAIGNVNIESPEDLLKWRGIGKSFLRFVCDEEAGVQAF